MAWHAGRWNEGMGVSLDHKVHPHVHRLLSAAGESLTPRARAQAEGARLWARVRRLLGMDLVSPQADREALEVACTAIQLPTKPSRQAQAGRPAQLTVRERAEQAAELLISTLGDIDEAMVTRTTKLLRELTARPPAMEEARLLSDALSLDDFGVGGLFVQAMAQGRQNGSLVAIAEGTEKREQYGYWSARLKDGFYFEPVRQIARRRLETAQQVAHLLSAELREDGLLP